MTLRQEKVGELLKQLSAKFFAKEALPGTLVTVTNCEVGSDLKKATVLISVLPDAKEEEALSLAKEKARDLRDFLKKNLKMKFLPAIEVKIDLGEKNRQLIEKLSNQE